MSQPARKGRGPITLFLESRRCRWATLVLLAVLVVYPLSYGPVFSAWWHLSRSGRLLRFMLCAYAPIDWVREHGPEWFRDWWSWYFDLWP